MRREKPENRPVSNRNTGFPAGNYEIIRRLTRHWSWLFRN